MKYKISWTENYATEIEAEEGLSEMEVFAKIDFSNKNNYYEGLYDFDVEELDEEEDDDTKH